MSILAMLSGKNPPKDQPKKKGPPDPPQPPGIPISKAQVDVVVAAKKYKYAKTWTCQCGSQLKIKSSLSRTEDASNFVPTRSGHATLPSAELNWAGLAEERGWKPDKEGMCPACQAGVDPITFKRLRRQAATELHERQELARLKEKYKQ